MKKYSIT